MTDSAVFVGGLPALLTSIVVTMVLAGSLPPEWDNGGTRWRIAGFYILWQVGTPVMPWYIDLPALFTCFVAMELVYLRYRRKFRLENET